MKSHSKEGSDQRVEEIRNWDVEDSRRWSYLHSCSWQTWRDM